MVDLRFGGPTPSGPDAVTDKEYVDAAIALHVDDTTDAHDATAISYAGSTGISATNVEGAIDELDAEKAPTSHGHALTIEHQFDVMSGTPGTSQPLPTRAAGTTIPVLGMYFSPTADNDLFFRFRAVGYASGNVTVSFDWYADTGTTGVCIWGAQLAAITPNTDTQDVETDGLAAADTTNTTHLGTTAQRLHRTTVVIDTLDSLTADDHVALRVYRDADAAGDTMTAGVILIGLIVSYLGS